MYSGDRGSLPATCFVEIFAVSLVSLAPEAYERLLDACSTLPVSGAPIYVKGFWAVGLN